MSLKEMPLMLALFCFAVARPAFCSSVPVEYDVPSDGRVSVGIYDQQGALVRQVVLGERMAAGKHTADWDGRDDDGQLVAAGHYRVRGAVNGVTCQYKMGVGNTGRPAWGTGKICAGNFSQVAGVGGDLITMVPGTEFAKTTQRLTPDGRMVWVTNTIPFGGLLTALAADDQHIYVAGVITTEFDAAGKLYFSDVIYRLNAKDGSYAPWPGQKDYVRLPSARRQVQDGPWKGYMNLMINPYHPDKRLSDPFPYMCVRGIAVFEGKLYLSLFQEDRVLIMDASSGTVTGEIKNIPQPQGVAISRGVLYIASRDRILKHELKTGIVSVLAGGFSAPYGVAAGPRGDVYVTDLGDSQQVKVISPVGKLKQTIGRKWFNGPYRDGHTDRLFFACGLTVDGKGNLVVADYGNSRLVHYDASGRITRTTEAFASGGNGGGARFMPGDASRLIGEFVPGLNINMTNMLLFRTDMEKSSWRTVCRWQDISPVVTMEPMCVRRLPNGRTYVYFGKYLFAITVFELKNGGRLEFCSALMAPRPGPLSFWVKPPIVEDARALGLVTDGPYGPQFRCRIVWTDRNRNGRMEKDEVALDESWTKDWANGSDFYVDEQGNMLVHSANDPVTLLLRAGFDEAGNPVYNWKNTRTVLDFSRYPWLAKDNLRIFLARLMDKQGNLYAGFAADNPFMPTKFRLAKFAADGRVLWKFGRKAAGLAPQPGEFSSVYTMAGMVDDILYVLDYRSPVVLLTADGLYLATLLKPGGLVEDDPYGYFGESFSGDVVKDEKTGKVYVTISTESFVLPCFEVLGLDTVKRFSGAEIVLDEQTLATLEKTARPEAFERGNDIVYLTDRTIKVDGDLADWRGIPETRSVVPGPDQPDQYDVKYRYACDGKTMFLAFGVKDSTPAINPLKGRMNLWHGDCLEFYFSNNVKRTTGCSFPPGSYAIHFAACPNPPAGKDIVGMGATTDKEWVTPPEVKTATRIWPDKKGYDLEAAIPLNLLGMDGLPAGTPLLMDWDIMYGTAKAQAEAETGDWKFKIGRDPKIDANNFWTGTMLWGAARAVRASGEEYAVYARPWPGDWAKMPVQAENKLPGVENEYAATLKAAYDAKGLRFFTEVRDPDPGLMTAGTAFLGMGDRMEVLVDGIDIYSVASPAYTTPYLVKGGQPSSIPGAISILKTGQASYTLEVSVPWEAVGGKKDKYSFNWRTGWSDKTGMGVFGQRLYRPEDQPAALIIIP